MGDSGRGSIALDLEEALRLVAGEAPTHFAEVRRRLADRVVVIRVGDEPPMSVCVAGGPPWVGHRANGVVDVSLSRADVRDLLAGELTLEEGILRERIGVRGSLDHLLAFFDALASWLHGAFRSPSLPVLHDRYLARPAGTSYVRAAPKGAPSC